MRKLFIILLLCLITQTLLCQISSIKFAENQTPEDIPLYDSIEVKDIRSLVGQTLFLKPTQKAIGNGYYTTVLKTGITTNANVYMPDHYEVKGRLVEVVETVERLYAWLHNEGLLAKPEEENKEDNQHHARLS